LEVVLSEYFKQQSLSLGVTRETALDILKKADRVQKEKCDDLIVHFFLKRETQTDSYLLLMAQVKNNALHPDIVLRVLPDLFSNILALEPVMILQLLAQKFGMVLRIGRRLGRFYYKENVVLGQKQDLVRLVQIVDETGHDCLGSFYVKIVETASGCVARCAFVFCIDKSKYNHWLASRPPKEKPADPTYRPITRIIPIERVRIVETSCIDESNRKERFYNIQLRLAIEIITAIMGDAWYRKVYESLPKVSGKKHPRLLKHYIRVIGLGHFLNQLWRENDSNNLSDKVEELRGSSFEHTYFELKIASHFDRRGFDVKFLRREEQLKTPDFQVTSADGYAFVECKRKSVSGLKIDSDIEKAALQIEEFGGPGLIFIELLERLDPRSVEKIIVRAATLLAGKNRVSMCIFTNEELRDEVDTYAVATQAWPTAVSGIRLSESIRIAALFQDPLDWFPLGSDIPSR
jgi:hypothetical protein